MSTAVLTRRAVLVMAASIATVTAAYAHPSTASAADDAAHPLASSRRSIPVGLL